jgi:membrane protein implicated in regulation of membrane protease activity
MEEYIRVDITLSPWIPGILLVVGVGYLLINLLIGEFDLGIDLGLDAAIDAGDGALGIGCNVIAVFCVGAGALGIVGSLAAWNPILTILLSLLLGLIVGRIFQKFLQFAMQQQSNDPLTKDKLIGLTARVTVNVPAGKIGEALVEEVERIKYAIKNVDNLPLQKGDMVLIVDVQAGRLLVRKIEVTTDGETK